MSLSSGFEFNAGEAEDLDALAFLGEEARVDAFLVERLDQLPVHLADVSKGES